VSSSLNVIVGWLSIALLCLSLLALGMRTRNRLFSIVGAICLASIPVVLAALYNRDPMTWRPWRPGVAGIAVSLGLAIYCALEAVGLPERIGLRLGVGFRPPESDFACRLAALWRQFDRLIKTARTQPGSRTECLRSASRVREAIRDLRPPSQPWAVLQENVTRCERQWIRLVEKKASDAEWTAMQRMYTDLAAQIRRLDDGLVASAGISFRQWQLRRMATAYIMIGAAAVVALGVLAGLIASDYATNPWAWISVTLAYICLLSVGLVSELVAFSFIRPRT
jgi:hypothetical protein